MAVVASAQQEDLHALVRQSRLEQQLIAEKLAALEQISSGNWHPGPIAGNTDSLLGSPLPRPAPQPYPCQRGPAALARNLNRPIVSGTCSGTQGESRPQVLLKGISSEVLPELTRSQRPGRHQCSTAGSPLPSPALSPVLSPRLLAPSTSARPQTWDEGLMPLQVHYDINQDINQSYRDEQWRALQNELAAADHALLEREDEVERLRSEVARLSGGGPPAPGAAAERAEGQPFQRGPLQQDQEAIAMRSCIGQLEAQAALHEAQRQRLFEDVSTMRKRCEATEIQCKHLQDNLREVKVGFARCISRVTDSLVAGTVQVSVQAADPVSRFALLRVVPPRGCGVLELYCEPDDARPELVVDLNARAAAVTKSAVGLQLVCHGVTISFHCRSDVQLQKWATALSLFQSGDLRAETSNSKSRSSFSPLHRSRNGNVVMPFGVYNLAAGSSSNPRCMCGESVNEDDVQRSVPIEVGEVARSTRPRASPKEETVVGVQETSMPAAEQAGRPEDRVPEIFSLSGINSLESWFAEYGNPLVVEEAERWPSFRKPLDIWPPPDTAVDHGVHWPTGILVDEAHSHRLLRGPDSRTGGAGASTSAPKPSSQPSRGFALPVVELFPGEEEVATELNEILRRADLTRTGSLTKTALLTLRDTEFDHFASWITDSRRFPAFDQNHSGTIERQELARALWIYRHSPEGGCADAIPSSTALPAEQPMPADEPFVLEGGCSSSEGRHDGSTELGAARS